MRDPCGIPVLIGADGAVHFCSLSVVDRSLRKHYRRRPTHPAAVAWRLCLQTRLDVCVEEACAWRALLRWTFSLQCADGAVVGRYQLNTPMEINA